MDLEAIGILILAFVVATAVVLLGALVHQLQVQERGEQARHADRMRQGDQLVAVMSNRTPAGQSEAPISIPHLDLPAPPSQAPSSARTPISVPTVVSAPAFDRDDADDPTLIFVGPQSSRTKVSGK